MKANEAPEKLYLFENPVSNEPDDRWLSSKSSEEDIEYIRKDTFIEKAAKWINEHTSLSEKLVIKDFIKYMEGE